MAKDKSLLDNLVRFIEPGGFAADMEALLKEHFGPALEQTGVEASALPELLSSDVYAMLFTWVVEDLVTRELADGRNLADAYMKRHGWKHGATVKRTIQALRASRARLYDVTAVSEGVGMTVQDVLDTAESAQVMSPGLAGVLPVGCPVGLRLLEIDGETITSASVLPFEEGMTAEASDAVAVAAGDAGNLAPYIASFWLLKTLQEKQGQGGSAPLDPPLRTSP